MTREEQEERGRERERDEVDQSQHRLTLILIEWMDTLEGGREKNRPREAEREVGGKKARGERERGDGGARLLRVRSRIRRGCGPVVRWFARSLGSLA